MKIIFLVFILCLSSLSSNAEAVWGLYTDGEINFVERTSILQGKYTENSRLTVLETAQQFKIKGIIYASSGNIILSFKPKSYSVEGDSLIVSLVNPENNKVQAMASFQGVFEGENISLLSASPEGISNINNSNLGSDNRAVFNIIGNLESPLGSQEKNYKGEFDLIITSL